MSTGGPSTGGPSTGQEHAKSTTTEKPAVSIGVVPSLIVRSWLKFFYQFYNVFGKSDILYQNEKLKNKAFTAVVLNPPTAVTL